MSNFLELTQPSITTPAAVPELPSPPLKSPKSRLRLFFEEERKNNLMEFQSILEETNWSHGDTKHQQMRSAFGSAASRNIDPDTAEDLIREKIADHGGTVDARSIRRMRAFTYEEDGHHAPDAQTPRKPKVERDPDFVARIIDSLGEEDAREILRSRSVEDPAGANIELILNTLYTTGENVLIFDDPRSQGACLYEVGKPIPDNLPTQAENGVFILTNPVDGLCHPNPREDGKLSRRSLESITAFRYLLLESDEVPVDEWLKIVVQLPLPIAAVCHSGGKSIHSLVQLNAPDKSAYDALREKLLPLFGALGADIQATSAVRLSRLPTAHRGEIEQELLYLNPNPQAIAIRNLKEIR